MGEMTIGMSKEDFKEQFPKAVLYGRVFFDPVNYGVICISSNKTSQNPIKKRIIDNISFTTRNKGV